jgi:nitroimidazol reductase NimA-like FMN-containing flavoprotein (pyridoxamine 5'-phosphate oxidase superfamily)
MSTLITDPRLREASMTDPAIRAALETILHEQRSGVLCSCFMDIPLCSQMAFAVDADLRTFAIVTPRQTTKFDNMSSNPNVSFLISTARNDPSDPASAQALIVTAFATELDGERRHQAVTLFSRRHPELSAFAAATKNAVMELKVDSYALIDHFQQVTRIGLG